jgi:hypothetical protein
MKKPDTEPQKDNQYEDCKYPYDDCCRYRISDNIARSP